MDDRRPTPRGLHRGVTTPFVGREAELERVLTRAQIQPSLTLVSGPGGIGKTRILREAVERLDSTVLYGRGRRGSDSTPFLPWTQIVDAASEMLSIQRSSRFRDLAPLVSGAAQQPRFAQGDAAQEVLGLALGEYLCQVAEAAGGPLVVVVDDLHHADAPSVALALALAEQQLPVALLTTSRPLDEARPGQAHLLERLTETAEVVELGPLAEADVAHVLEMQGVAPERAVDAMAVSSGIPLLLDHWVRHADSSTELDYRSSVRGVVEQLGDDALDLLTTAALVGDAFDLVVVAEATGVTVPQAMSLMQRAAAVDLVDPIEGSLTGYRFRHESLLDAIESSADAAERAERHRKLLEVLAARRGTAGEEDVSVLARHATEAAFVGAGDEAILLNLEAGRHALDRSAPSAALINFQRARDVAAALGAPRRLYIEAILGLGRAQRMASDATATDALLTVLEAAEDDPDLTTLGIEAALLLPGNLGTFGLSADRDALAVRWLTWALERTVDEPSPIQVELMIALALQTYAKSHTEGEALLEKAAALATEIGEAQLRARASSYRHWFRRAPGEMDAVLEELDALERSIDATDFETRMAIAGSRTAALMRSGRFNEALAQVRTMEIELGPLPLEGQWAMGRWRAAIDHVRGDIDGAELTALSAYALVERTPLAVVAFDYLSVLLAGVYHARFQHELVIAQTAALVESPSPLLAVVTKAGGAMLLAEIGRDAEAREMLTHVPRGELDYRDPHEVSWLPSAAFLASTAVPLGDDDRCRDLVDALEPFRGEWVIGGGGYITWGPIALIRAKAALVAGMHEVCEDDLVLARREVIASGGRLFEPGLLASEAELAFARDEIPKAVALMSHASDACAELDLPDFAAVLAARALELANHADREVASGGRRLVREGAVWRVEFDDETGAVAHVKGLVALDVLLRKPGREFHVLELAAVVDQVSGGLIGEPVGTSREGSDPLLDQEAMTAYRSRVVDLQAEIDDAQRNQDIGRQSAAQEELDALLEHLQASIGLGGRSRPATSNAERARVRMTKILRSAISRIGEVAPKAGHHLSVTVRTGMFCGYEPTPSEPTWRFGDDR